MAEERVTWCPVCEACCGLIARVEADRVIELRSDSEHPLSAGYACPKGIAFTEIQNDPDRVLYPLRRRGKEFERVSWEQALAEIGARTRAIRERHGNESIGWYAGVPYTFSFGHMQWSKNLMRALRSPHYYSAVSQDTGSRHVASHLLYGSALELPIPDVERTDFLLIVGANPFVSNGSVLTAPRLRERLHAIPKRGGRVVVADPRRTETARAFEHLAVRPDNDAFLLLSILAVIFGEGHEDRSFLDQHTRGAGWLREIALAYPPERTAERTGADPAAVREIARAFACADRAVAYGRTGVTRGRFATLTSFLIDALSIVTGNLDRPGGLVFTAPAIPLIQTGKRMGGDSYGRRRTRVGGLPDVIGELPAAVMAEEIRTPGRGQLRALFVSGGNPVMTTPGSDQLEQAISELDLLVSIDFYINDTGRQADFILPSATYLEKSEPMYVHAATVLKPFLHVAEQAVPPAGEAREDWEIIEAIANELGVTGAPPPLGQLLKRLGVKMSPRRAYDLILRTGPHGDLFGLRRTGLSLARLAKRYPHGARLAEHHPTGVLSKHVDHAEHRVDLSPTPLAEEVARLAESVRARSAQFPLLLTSLRELRSHNSWTHNSPKLMRARRFALRMHPRDAAVADVEDGQTARLASQHGSITVPVQVSDEMMPGTVCLPWGWGHNGGWQVANAAGGANINRLHPADARHVEALSGMSWLNGLPVRVEPVSSSVDAHAPGRAAGATASAGGD